MNNFKIDPELIERLAQASHTIFCDELTARGFKYGQYSSDINNTHNSLKPYSALSEDEKEQNRDYVRDIPCKLVCLGYGLRLKRSKETYFKFSNDEIETLAEKEHYRWIKQKLDDGWHYGIPTDKTKKVHSDIVSWEQLTEIAKEKDRIMVRSIPCIVEKAGYMISKLTKSDSP